MHPHSYTKFYALIVFALAVGFIAMEVSTGGLTPSGSLVSGMAVNDVDGVLAGSGFSDIVLLIVGFVVGAICAGVLIHLYHAESKF